MAQNVWFGCSINNSGEKNRLNCDMTANLQVSKNVEFVIDKNRLWSDERNWEICQHFRLRATSTLTNRCQKNIFTSFWYLPLLEKWCPIYRFIWWGFHGNLVGECTMKLVKPHDRGWNKKGVVRVWFVFYCFFFIVFCTLNFFNLCSHLCKPTNSIMIYGS